MKILNAENLVNSVQFKKCHENQMEHVKKGCLSDLPNVNYYLQVSGPESSKKIFEFYKTIRGTSQTENFHLISADIFNFVTHMSPETYYPLAMGKATHWNVD